MGFAMSPGAVAVTHMSWCQCELPTCLRPVARFSFLGLSIFTPTLTQGPGLSWDDWNREVGSSRLDCSQLLEATLGRS